MHPLQRRRFFGSALAAILVASLAVVWAPTAANAVRAPGAVYVMTNEAAGNRVLAFGRAADGTLGVPVSYDTGGLGSGKTRLSSQGSVILSRNGRHLFVVNVGSDEISSFTVGPSGLHLVATVPSGGVQPNSLTLDGQRLYVLNNGGDGAGNVTAFDVGYSGDLAPVPESTRSLSGDATDPAQVQFSPDGRTLVVTEKATNQILTYPVGPDGLAGEAVVHPSNGITPFGFAFTRRGAVVVSEAFEGVPGQAAASSYLLDGVSNLKTISGSVPDHESEVCWTVITRNGRFAYVTNFGSGSISSYTVARDGALVLLQQVAAVTTPGELSIRDHGLSRGDRYLYAIDIASQKVHAWAVERDGSLEPIGAFDGLPPTVAGLAVA